MVEFQREIIYLGSSQKDARKLPEDVQELFAYALELAVRGGHHEDAKPLSGFHGRSVIEVVSDHRGDTFREIYTVRFEEAVYVLHIFKKKSKKGIATPKEDMELITKRLKWAEALHKDFYEKKNSKKSR
jgi:phage-related protein